MEKAMNAAMTSPPTVPPTMRIVLVLTPPDDEDWDWATAVDDAVEDVVELAVGVEVVSVGNAVGTGVELSVVVVTCVFAVATRAALSSEDEVVTGMGVDDVVGVSVAVSGVDVVEGVTTTTAEVVGASVVDGASELVTTTIFGVV